MNEVKRFLGEGELKAISDAIRSAELRTSGEIRVSIRDRRAKKDRSLVIERLAWGEFEHLGMTRTKKRNGVLIFLLLRDRQLSIVADEGIHAKVEAGLWQRLVDQMVQRFQKKEYLGGLIHTVEEVGKVLAQHFPKLPDDVNELPDDVQVN